jgi:uncharacterized protein YecE (DUF72 family)
MPAQLKIGNCGWSYIIPEHFAGQYSKPYSDKLEAYAQLYNSVEINSTYYAIPRLTTAQKWRREASDIDSQFEFTVKAFQGITHRNRFGKEPIPFFDSVRQICSAVEAKLLLFQSPANFLPIAANVAKMQVFFNEIDRGGLVCVWEPRGKWYDDPQRIVDVCKGLNLIHCVDPFRNEPLVFGKERIAYFRLHGFGKPSIYHYDFSKEELSWLQSVVLDLSPKLKRIYVLFNNMACYENARTFQRTMNLAKTIQRA